MQKITLAAAIAAALAGVASARPSSTDGNLAAWTFETTLPVTAGPHQAEGGVFAATSTALGSTGGTYSNPVGNGSAESFSSNGWDAGDYYQFTTSTLGYTALSISFDQVRSSTGPGVFDLVASTDGVNFMTIVDDYAVRANDAPFWGSATRVEADIFKINLSASFDDAATLVFRLVSQVAATSTAGTNRVDNVFVNGVAVPTPGAAALMGLAGLVGARRRR